MKRVILITLVILIPLGVFSPGLVSLLWHARHGNNIEYAGKRIPVPLRWYAHIESHSVQLSKLPITVFSWVNRILCGPSGTKPWAHDKLKLAGRNLQIIR